jgi:hypothetical protein
MISYSFLGIGIDKYKSIKSLSTPANDVREVADILCEEYGFTRENTKLLLGEEATHDAIIKALHSYVDVPDSQEDTSLIIYFAGHGRIQQKSDSYYWLAYNSLEDEVSKENWIPADEIKGILKQIKARHVLLICDTCFSADLISRLRSPAHRIIGESRYLSDAMAYRSREVLASGMGETVKDGFSNTHSPMAFALIDALASCKEQWIDALGLFDFVRRALSDQRPQYGCLPHSGHQEGGAFILFKKEAMTSRFLAHEKPSPAEKKKKRRLWPLLLVIPLALFVLFLLKDSKTLPSPLIKADTLLNGKGWQISPFAFSDGSVVSDNVVFHYTTDGSEPTRLSPVYKKETVVFEPTHIKAIATKGWLYRSEVSELDAFDMINAASLGNGAKATAESVGVYLNVSRPAENAIDSNAGTSWSNMKTMPTWIEVEFAQAFRIEEVCFLWSGHTQAFNVYLSLDHESWTKVINSEISNNMAFGEDATDYVCEASKERQVFIIDPTLARYLKVEIVGSSAPRSHLFKTDIMELEAWGYKQE